jgi:hypothetical protein
LLELYEKRRWQVVELGFFVADEQSGGVFDQVEVDHALQPLSANSGSFN